MSAVRKSRSGFLSPVVRRLLVEHGLDASEVEGTGAGGRITRADVETVVAARAGVAPDAGAAEADSPFDDPPVAAPLTPPVAELQPERSDETLAEPPPPPIRVSSPHDDDLTPPEAGASTAAEPAEQPAPAAPMPPPSAPAPREPRGTLVPFTSIRRRIGANLRDSISTAAHAFCAVEADFERVDRLRREHGDTWREREGFSLTYLPFVARAVCAALEEFPHLNASVVDDGLLVHHDVHLGVAVDLDHEGLIVPVVHDAGRKWLLDVAREVADLAARARSGRLGPDEVTGATFTITNPGPSGTVLSVPIINQPQIGILATDTVRRRPVVVPTGDGGEGIAIHATGTLGLSFDHRAVDGAYAASFVSRVAAIVGTHDWGPELEG